VAVIAVLVGAAEILIPYHSTRVFCDGYVFHFLVTLQFWLLPTLIGQQVLKGLTQIDVGWNRFDIAAIIAIAGTTISPYLFFWQAAEEIEESGHAPDTSQSHIRAMRGDVLVGMFSGVFVMFAIMTTTAATLNAEGITQITSPEQAAMALAPIAGDAAGVIFALGILGTGLLAVPVLAGSTAYAVSEAMGWREGLESRPSQAKLFYAVIALSMAIAVAH
jgi:Mn2+/Fe2+ NRAMP family transporter